MAYAASGMHNCGVFNGGANCRFIYTTADAEATVRAANYFGPDAINQNLRVDDLITVVDTTLGVSYDLIVTAVSQTADTATTARADARAGTILTDDNVVPGMVGVYRIDIADGAGDTDVTITHKSRVLDCWAVKTAANGGAGDTVTLKNVTTAITSAIDLNVNDTLIARTTLINDASHEIAAGAIMRVTAANVTNNACTVYVLAALVD